LLAISRGTVSLASVGLVDEDFGDRRRRSDLVNDLVAGADNEGASARARELGHDLDGRHWMVLTQYRDQPVDGALATRWNGPPVPGEVPCGRRMLPVTQRHPSSGE
jgi:hypothetical protein